MHHGPGTDQTCAGFGQFIFSLIDDHAPGGCQLNALLSFLEGMICLRQGCVQCRHLGHDPGASVVTGVAAAIFLELEAGRTHAEGFVILMAGSMLFFKILVQEHAFIRFEDIVRAMAGQAYRGTIRNFCVQALVVIILCGRMTFPANIDNLLVCGGLAA